MILSLRKLLEYYPLLNGIFKVYDQDKKVSIEQNDGTGGILFVSTTINIPLNEIHLLDNTNTKIIPETLQLINIVDSETLFHVCHTRFLCGSVALGITLNHQLADAHSYFQLVKDWAILYKNFEYQPNVCHQRSLLELTQEEINILKNSNSDFNHRRSLSVKEESASLPPTSTAKQIIVKVFRFSAHELERMKSDSITHLPFDVDYVSTFEVLTAHLYQHVMLARHHSPSSMTKLYISTNIRSRLIQPSIPITYFGNAIMFSYLEVPMSELVQTANLGLLASQIHKSIQANNNDDIRTTLAWIICQRDKTKITPTFNLDETDFTISAWNKMGMYSNSDFELGNYPCRILLPPDTKFNGAAILLSTEKTDQSIDVILGLEINEMERLESNSDFRKYCKEEK